ncbi:DUF6266 family protein [Pedobacter gandavensis]|uniref:DUF6266 family protein n=1 Tax=Pedobacter gandavensis TaxID=2679963 RepID=UPI00292DDEFB|nr:DUF6266 family protein [Pedobacter gandavensis]
MAIVIKSICGHLSGDVGSTVDQGKNDKSLVRDVPDPLAPKKPLTEGQRIQREKFEVLKTFLKPFSKVLDVGFKNQASGLTPKTKALAVNLPRMIIGYNKEILLNVVDLKLSEGYAARLGNLQMEDKGGGLFRLTWDKCDNILGKYNVISLVLYDDNQHKVFYTPNLTPVNRQEAEFLLGDLVGHWVHVYVFTVGVKVKGVKNSNSNSQYLGMVS